MRFTAAILMLPAALAVATAAHAATLTTPPLHPDTDGRLACTAVNASGRAIGIVARIVADDGQIVTDFASTQWADEAAGVLASVSAESHAETARYCTVSITGGGRSQVRASLEAFDATGTRTAVVEAH